MMAHVTMTFFSFQNLIETGAFDAMTPRKSGLISLTLNRFPE